jgi:hypothetical protein
MLMILHAVCSEALEAFYAAHNPVDKTLVADLERMVERTRRELEAPAPGFAEPSY